MISTKLLGIGLRSLITLGPWYTWERYRSWRIRTASPEKQMKKPLYTTEELLAQKSRVFPFDIQFSIVVPLYRTPAAFLREMIESVQNQTYGNWELILADGSAGEDIFVEEICLSYASQDPRIRYRKLEKNLGISGNTNEALRDACGDFIALLDHDDVLHPAALYEVMRRICDRNPDLVYTDEAIFKSPRLSRVTSIHYKPDYGPDTLRSHNYFCHFTVFRRSLLEKTGGFRSEYDGSQDHDLVLRIAAVTDRIEHIPKPLYYWRNHAGSSASGPDQKSYAYAAGANAVRDSIIRAGMAARAVPSAYAGFSRIFYEIKGDPLVSIIIPCRDQTTSLDRCLHSLAENSSWKHAEILLVDLGSTEPQTFSYYRRAEQKWASVRAILPTEAEAQSVRDQEPGLSGGAAVINAAVRREAAGDFFLFLCPQAAVITPDWIQELLMYVQRPDVGAAGAKLYYQDDTVRRAGIILGIRGTAGQVFYRWPRESIGACCRLVHVQNLSAVSGSCMMVRRAVWETVGGLDTGYAAVLGDADLCLRIRAAGFLIVWTPYAELYEYEETAGARKAAGSDAAKKDPRQLARFREQLGKEIRRNRIAFRKCRKEEKARDEALFRSRWAEKIAAGDPYYNPNFTLTHTDFGYTEKPYTG